MSGRQVSDATLLGWLDASPSRLERYLERHPEAADRLERLTAMTSDFGTRLGAALSPPPDLAVRLAMSLKPDPLTRETSALVGDLLGLGWYTVRAVLDPERDQSPAARHEE